MTMSATLNKLIVGSGIFVLLIFASGAQAAPSIGYPQGRPYYGSNNHRSGTRSFRSYAPAYSTETRQSFSYQPVEKGAKVQSRCQGQVAAPATAKPQAKK